MKNPSTSSSAPAPSKEVIIRDINRHLLRSREEKCFEFGNIQECTAKAVISELSGENFEEHNCRVSYDSIYNTLSVVVMPTKVHEVCGDWLVHAFGEMRASNWISKDDRLKLNVLASPDDFPFVALYQASHKQPDICVLPDGSTLPSIVGECGWSESTLKLGRDMRTWLLGGQPEVQLLVVMRFSRVGSARNRVAGYVETYERQGTTNTVCTQKETIFPVPPSRLASQQTITITRGQLWGPALPNGQNANDSFDLVLDDLRTLATRLVTLMGYRPA